jgi:hypothetical protein
MIANAYVYGVAGLEGLGTDDRNAKTRLSDTIRLALFQMYEKVLSVYCTPPCGIHVVGRSAGPRLICTSYPPIGIQHALSMKCIDAPASRTAPPIGMAVRRTDPLNAWL